MKKLGVQPIGSTLYIIAAVEASGLAASGYTGRTINDPEIRRKRHQKREIFKDMALSIIEKTPIPVKYQRAFEQYGIELFDFFIEHMDNTGRHSMNGRNEIRKPPNSPRLQCDDLLGLI